MTRRGVALVHLNRALSKRGVLTRSQATEAVLAGRVRVDGRVVRDPAARVDLEQAAIEVDRTQAEAVSWRTMLFNKPRGVLTTSRDPEGRKTVYDVIGEPARALVTVGRLDFATSGLLLLTTDTTLAAWLTDPGNRVPRVYVATVRGRVTPADAARLEDGVMEGDDRLQASAVVVRKTSYRESHLIIELMEGKNREVRRLCQVIGHEVTRLKRVGFGSLELGGLAPGAWRELTREDVSRAFPSFKV